MMGDTNSITITKKVACPHCKNEITVQGTSGEIIEITCPKCNAKGIFAFPEEKPVSISTTGPVAIEVNNLEFTYPKSDKKAVNGVSFGSDILTAMNGGASYEARFAVIGSESKEVCSSR